MTQPPDQFTSRLWLVAALLLAVLWGLAALGVVTLVRMIGGES